MLTFSWEPGGGTFDSQITVSKEVCAFENLPIEIEQGAASSSPTISSEGCSKGVQEATANPKKPSLACDSVMTLLDMYAGMYTGLCMGAAASDFDLNFADYMFEIDTFQTMHGLDGRQTRIGDAASNPEFCIDGQKNLRHILPLPGTVDVICAKVSLGSTGFVRKMSL